MPVAVSPSTGLARVALPLYRRGDRPGYLVPDPRDKVEAPAPTPFPARPSTNKKVTVARGGRDVGKRGERERGEEERLGHKFKGSGERERKRETERERERETRSERDRERETGRERQGERE